MHANAQKWDEEHGFVTAFGKKPQRVPYIPKDRPCDWCGVPVAQGFIHVDCAWAEQSKWNDILD